MINGHLALPYAVFRIQQAGIQTLEQLPVESFDTHRCCLVQTQSPEPIIWVGISHLDMGR
jgi:hypothetical protein